MRAAILAAMAATALVAACALDPSAPSVVVPDKLRPPPDESLVRTLSASGVQVYECRAAAADASSAEWTFVAPEASLQDEHGESAGRHGAGPAWEARDGSRVVGTVKAQVAAPVAGAISWLLLQTRSTGRKGAFAKVSSIQRVATEGGVAPATGCTAATVGQQARVPYRAQYVLYAKIL